MKNILDYLQRSHQNKYKVLVIGILVYLLLYISANPNVYNIYFIRLRSFINYINETYITPSQQNNLVPVMITPTLTLMPTEAIETTGGE